MRRPRLPRAASLAMVAGSVALAVAGCGGDGDRPSSPPSAGPRGATVAVPELPSTLDPAKASTLSERLIATATQTPLLTYRRTTGDDAATLQPALAGDLPTLSPDEREYRFQLRRGLVYADGALVKASDVERAIAHTSVVSPDPALRATLASIAGAPSRDGQTLSGVRSDDRTGVVVVLLRRPDGRIPFALADPATAPLPELPKDGRAPASTGPLRIASQSGRSIELAANPLRPTISTVPAAKLSQVSLVQGSAKLAEGVSSKVLKAGTIDVDLGGVGPRDGVKSGVSILTGSTTSIAALYMPQTGLTSSRALRRLIAGAIDARTVGNSGQAAAACSLVPSFAVGSVDREPCPAAPADQSGKPLAGATVRVALPSVLWATVAEDLVDRAITRLGGSTAIVTSSDPVRALRSGKADVAIGRSSPRLPHPSLWLDQAAHFDALVAREVPRLTRGPLTGTGGQWSAVERRAVDRAVAVPLLAIKRRVVVGPQIDRRSVLIHPVLGLDLAALDVS